MTGAESIARSATKSAGALLRGAAARLESVAALEDPEGLDARIDEAYRALAAVGARAEWIKRGRPTLPHDDLPAEDVPF